MKLILFALASLSSLTSTYAKLDEQPGKLPTLGWNSWRVFPGGVNETNLIETAKAFNSSGLKNAGYTYMNMDDGWQLKSGRAPNGSLVPDPSRFPSGIQSLIDQVHDMGLKFGLYSSAGTLTCGKHPGSLDHEERDAEDFASWGVDYLKYDNCGIPKHLKDTYRYCVPGHGMNVTEHGTCNTEIDPTLAPPGYNWRKSHSYTRYQSMSNALKKQTRDILYSMCIWGQADVTSWGKGMGTSWRISSDAFPFWKDIVPIININSFKVDTTDFYAHNDCDLIQVGNSHGNLTAEENRSHFSLWAAMKSPLLINADLTSLTPTNIELLTNKYLLAFNQDTVHGAAAKPYKWEANPKERWNATWPAEYWAGQSQAGTMVLMLNPDSKTRAMSAIWSEIPGLSGSAYYVTDVWTKANLGCIQNSYSVEVASHDTAVILVGEKCSATLDGDEVQEPVPEGQLFRTEL